MPGRRLPSFLGSDGVHFARYDALDLTSGKYAETSGAGFATVEIFRFPDFVKAFGAYSTRKEGAQKFLPIANESFEKSHSLHVWRGPFYIRVTGAAHDEQALIALTSFVADKIPPAPNRPAVFGYFPDKARLPNSERYSAEDGFGQPFLGNSFQATFAVDTDKFDGLIIPSTGRPQATAILNAYRQLFVRNGKLLDPITNLGEDNFTAEDRYLGRAVAFRLDRFVVVFNGYGDRQHLVDLATLTDQRIIGSIRKELNADDDKPGPHDQQPGWTQR